MRILFTGASSFTGFWFVRELLAAGHQITATFQGSEADYDGVRQRRVVGLVDEVETIWQCRFGDSKFLDLTEQGNWDLLCHHAADVTDYKSDGFDVSAALAANTRNIRKVVKSLAALGSPILCTGSVFEPGEGAGSDHLPAFSPYGLSKSLSWQVVAYYCREMQLPAAKFVIPNPFGPFEEARFTSYLMTTWKRGESAGVNTPDYVRDNIHVSLLARAYRHMAESIDGKGSILSPSGYVESQGNFAKRVADEVRIRTGLDCALEVAKQDSFSEPRIRIGTDVPSSAGWDEGAAWDQFVDWYMEKDK